LAFYLAPGREEAVTIETEEGAQRAVLPLSAEGAGEDVPWTLAAWRARYGAIAAGAARDRMRGFAAGALRPHAMLLTREGSRARAGEGPRRLRPAAAPGSVAVADARAPYASFFAVEEYDLSFRRFDGGMGE